MMVEFQKIWEGILNFNFSDFNWPVMIFPVFVILFLVFFFRAYNRDLGPRPGTLEWIEDIRRPRFSLLSAPGRVNERDWLYLFLLTVAYGVLAFSFSGDAVAPQSFWRASGDQMTATLDLGALYDIDTIMYYTGLVDGDWKLEFSANEQEWREQGYWKTNEKGEQEWTPGMTQRWGELFHWRYATLESDSTQPTRYIRLTAGRDGMELGELVLVTRNAASARELFDLVALSETHTRYAALFDEQVLFPASPDQNNSMYFDEIYHARTAYEYIRNIRPTETTHPPLGKSILSLGIRIFGMTPFGWRFMGILFGILMVPLFYVFLKNIFDQTTIAVCGTAIFAFENMHYTQTHLATIDTYVVFFILAMYFFMYRYISSGYETPFIKTLPPLLLCGISFGLGAASKWTGFYAALGLVALYVVYLAARGRHQFAAEQGKEFRVFLFQTLAASILCFVVIPFVIYTASYIPYAVTSYYPNAGEDPFLIRLLTEMWDNQKLMLNYHGASVLNATHPYESRWWMWMLDIRPILYYSNYSDESRTLIGAFTNPLVTIGGLVAMCYALSDFFWKKCEKSLFIVVGYLSQLVPWMLISRITFVYHYFPSMIFLTLAICNIFSNILRRYPEHKRRVLAFTGVSIFLFVLLFPPTAGLKMPDWYSAYFVKWLPSWPF